MSFAFDKKMGKGGRAGFLRGVETFSNKKDRDGLTFLQRSRLESAAADRDGSVWVQAMGRSVDTLVNRGLLTKIGPRIYRITDAGRALLGNNK